MPEAFATWRTVGCGLAQATWPAGEGDDPVGPAFDGVVPLDASPQLAAERRPVGSR